MAQRRFSVLPEGGFDAFRPFTRRRSTIPTPSESTSKRILRSMSIPWLRRHSAMAVDAVPVHVVIIGGGYAGCLLSKGLEDSVKRGITRLTIIERRDFMHHKIAAFRASVTGDENWITRTQIPLHLIIKYGRIVVGDVSEVNASTKTIHFHDASQQPVHYDILVAATGASNLCPADIPSSLTTRLDVAEHFRLSSQAIEEASNILIIGCGAGSLELAGEIRSMYATKKITLITAGSGLLSSSVSSMTSNFISNLHSRLQDLDIETIFEERVISPTQDEVATRKILQNVTVKTRGKLNMTKHYDLVIWCAPMQIQTGIYPIDWINEIGELNVEPTFHIRSQKDIFALGDVTSFPEAKQAITLPTKIPIIVHNIKLVAKAMNNGTFHPYAEIKGLKQYKFHNKGYMFIPLGPIMGVTQINRTVYGDAKTTKWKGKDLFCDYFWQNLTGLKGSDIDMQYSRQQSSISSETRSMRITETIHAKEEHTIAIA